MRGVIDTWHNVLEQCPRGVFLVAKGETGISIYDKRGIMS
jgi:hypothetical protein